MVDTTTEKVDVLLRDEKEYIGILRSYDQFGMRPPTSSTTLVHTLTLTSQPRPHRMLRADSSAQSRLRQLLYRTRLANT